MRKCIIIVLYLILLAYTKRPAKAASGLLSVEPVPVPTAQVPQELPKMASLPERFI